MRTFRLLFVSVLTLFALAVGGLAPAAASQQAASDTKCKDVSAVATGVGTIVGTNVETTATVTKDPLLKGDLAGHFVLTGPASFAGDIIFTTKRGTLTIDAAGTLSSTGAFETSGSVISGTGNFAGATGSLVIEGVQDPSGAFTETIEGEICLSQ